MASGKTSGCQIIDRKRQSQLVSSKGTWGCLDCSSLWASSKHSGAEESSRLPGSQCPWTQSSPRKTQWWKAITCVLSHSILWLQNTAEKPEVILDGGSLPQSCCYWHCHDCCHCHCPCQAWRKGLSWRQNINAHNQSEPPIYTQTQLATLSAEALTGESCCPFQARRWNLSLL